ncbi:uncharacterized protein VP01_1838g3 [Puccinia sorghi]|uniref:DUF8040 domain-containing protein n=1 Tax=Puccinia sorghi TaxID=27349 RepID=A0A0L6VFM7_9BASI|nr:uncharacterized protein VP01_1838g3 [Puccinia sorghi]
MVHLLGGTPASLSRGCWKSQLGRRLVVLKGLGWLSCTRKRYLANRPRVERAPNITEYLFNLDTARFKQEFRMSQESFYTLLSLIEHHPIFSNNSNMPQQPLVTLRHMGMIGNGASIRVMARFFRISEGTVILYCSRVVEAILALERFVLLFFASNVFIYLVKIASLQCDQTKRPKILGKRDK